jgi:hypothetical protein
MNPGDKLKSGVLYYTKNGHGEVVPFNMGIDYTDFRNTKPTIMDCYQTKTPDVWSAGIDRHITAIAETAEEAKTIKY